MSERNTEFRAFYQRNRIDDLLAFYNERRTQSRSASGRTLILSGVLLAAGSVATVLAAGVMEWNVLWSTLATVLPAISSALVAYTALFDFDRRSTIFENAAQAIQAELGTGPGQQHAMTGWAAEQNTAELVERVERVVRLELDQQALTLLQIQISNEGEDFNHGGLCAANADE